MQDFQASLNVAVEFVRVFVVAIELKKNKSGCDFGSNLLKLVGQPIHNEFGLALKVS